MLCEWFSFCEWFSLYDVVPDVLFPPLVTLGFALQFVPEVAEQFHYYAEDGQRWSVWPALVGGAAGKHTLDLIDDPAPYFFALVAGLDLGLLLGISMVGSQLIQWRGVNEGTGAKEDSTYDVLGRDMLKVYGAGRVWVFVLGAALTTARLALLLLI